jgi:hypothetical protein
VESSRPTGAFGRRERKDYGFPGRRGNDIGPSWICDAKTFGGTCLKTGLLEM